ncbi:MAG: ABC transporter ATP-binding protein [Burkholderiales bacterium]|jgi:iron(III) transport system ATP-binding protein|nr:ABC transporter ATP-binding protein [Burkholderiales bacterium]
MKPPQDGVVFDRVSKRYGDVLAVDDVSFRVAKGELVTLLGPSGCGKTTTLRMVAGLEPVSEGRVLIETTDVTLRAANERDVSMVFQSYALFPHMSVLENVCYGPLSMGTDKAKAREIAHAKLRTLGLAGMESRLPSELSGGQQQRVAVARSLVLEPKVLLFDEPLSNLDAKLRRRVRQEIRELQQELELTVLYVTHDQEEALAVSDHIIVMDRGKIAQQGTPRELYEAPASRFLADFIGDANLIDGELSGGAFSAGGVSAPVHSGGTASGPATLAVRPHRLKIVDAGRGPIPGSCKRAAYLGSRNEYVVATAWGELLVFDDDANDLRARDSACALDFDPGAVILLAR